MKKPSTLDVLLMLVPDEEKQKVKAVLSVVQLLAPALPTDIKCFPVNNYNNTGVRGVALTALNYQGDTATLESLVKAVHISAEVFEGLNAADEMQLNVFIPTGKTEAAKTQ